MYKMIKAVTHDGIDKLIGIAVVHSLYGWFYTEPAVGRYICFVYDDNSEKMMCSTTIKEINHVDDQIRIKTLNSEYWFEKIVKLEEE
jgi:hypothetical protein